MNTREQRCSRTIWQEDTGPQEGIMP